MSLSLFSFWISEIMYQMHKTFLLILVRIWVGLKILWFFKGSLSNLTKIQSEFGLMQNDCKSPNSRKGFTMENAHTISALCAKIAHIQGEIDLHYKAIKGFETKADTLKCKQTFQDI